MNVLNEFRTDQHLNTLYRGRLEYERVRKAEIGELKDERAARIEAQAEAEAAKALLEEERRAAAATLEAERAEVALLRAQLAAAMAARPPLE